MTTPHHAGMAAQEEVHRVVSNGIGLNVLELAPQHRSRATVVMQHGLRDSAYALMPIARQLSRHFLCCCPNCGVMGAAITAKPTVFMTSSSTSARWFLLSPAGASPCLAIVWADISLADMRQFFPEHVEAVAIIEGLGRHTAHTKAMKLRRCRSCNS